ncbi:sensor histidine kinase [Jiella marina]|uniref:sensor histidine kinase n=1 Tax=Jiella sp. LLJ827 TaxID=2917712 RepID=UPI002100EF2A|nr:sensor histidine kinase [Jiella sp. LLJ827]MCQ0987618.1 ATP-binding protein [Jiella sp. LLJ827]
MLRRVVPPLVILFLLGLAATRLIIATNDQSRILDDARHDLAIAARLLSVGGEAAAEGLAEFDVAAFLVGFASTKIVPDSATAVVADRNGLVTHAMAGSEDYVGLNVHDIMSDSRHLVGFDAGSTAIDTSFRGVPAIAAAAELPNRAGNIVIIRTEAEVLSVWRDSLSLAVTLFALTSLIMLVILYAYFRQTRRAETFDTLCSETNQRVDIALSRGKCGLLDWDIARGRMYWSRSMYEILGMEPGNGVLSFADVAPLVHPEDVGLFEIARAAADGRIEMLDRVFRMRRADGDYVSIRARADVTTCCDGGTHLIGIAVDVTEQQELARKTNEANIRLQNTIEHISETFLLCDRDARVVVCNSIYRQTFGLDEADVLPGTPVEEVLRKAHGPSRVKPLQGDMAESESAVEAEMPDGRWLLISARRTADGGSVSIGTDITQIKHHQTQIANSREQLLETIKELEAATADAERKAAQLSDLNLRYMAEKDRAETASRAKTTFLANMSHELRTPLNAILGFSDLIRHETFGVLANDKYSEYVQDIHKSGTHLLRMIDDILELATIESGRLELTRESIELADIVRDSAALVEPLAKEKQVRMSIETPERLTMTSDRRATTQVVLNLLSNAVKFAAEGGAVRLRLRRLGDTAILTIADNGSGLSKQAMASLGLPFGELDNELVRSKHGGHRLGLAIARSLVGLHGGRIRLSSRVDDGTVVTLRLPTIASAKSHEHTADSWMTRALDPALPASRRLASGRKGRTQAAA